MRNRVALALAAVLFLVAARQRAVLHPVASPLDVPPPDVFSHAEPSQVVVRHVSLDLTVDFDARRLAGSATLHLYQVTASRSLVLDTRDLQIHRVTRDDGAAPLFTLGPASSLGRALTIPIEPDTRSVTVHYTTSEGASGLHWITPQQTFGRTQPFVYSQNEAHHARSWIPIQDSPQIRMTYDATIRVPRGMLALMSATNPQAPRPDSVYRFAMDQTVPAYLIALAVGRLEFRALGDRSGIYAEPELIEAAVRDVPYLPDMLSAAERLLGPHPWGRWDILLMPPTYVVGGMEHPRLNFINPFSVVTFNSTLPQPSSLLAHELAHSWAGNLSTLAAWEDIWINEGLASYLEMRIIEEMSGSELVEYLYFSDRSGYADLVRTADDPRITVLHRPYATGDSPDDRFDTTAYVKGELFFRTLEDAFGRSTMDAFLGRFFAKFSFRWVDDRNVIGLLEHMGLSEERLRLAEWIYQPGLPANVSAPTSSRLYERVRAEATAFSGGRTASSLQTAGWTDVELSLFLGLIGSAVRPRMAEVDAAFGLSSRPAAPYAWLVNGIHAGYAPVYPAVERILLRGGTNGQISGLYWALISAGQTRRAAEWFAVARDRYHPAVAEQIADWLARSSARAA